MNQKTAKKLRQIAFGMVVAAQEQGKEIAKVAHGYNKRGELRVKQDTWKGAYKALKKGLRASHKGDAFAKQLDTIQMRQEAVAAL